MPIIIETPAPPTRERLVLVSPSSVSNPIETLNGEVFTVRTTEARDATAADLERAGYVTGEMLAEQVRIVLAASKDAISRAEAERDDAIRLHEERRDEEARLCERMERELDAERREGRDREHTLRARAMRAEEELAEYRSTAAAVSAEMSDLTLELCTHRERADAAERERDSLRAELAALRAPAEGEPSDNDLRDVWDAGETLSDSRRALWRAGVAHERGRGDGH